MQITITRRGLFIAAVLVVLGVAAGMGFAATTSPSDVISACVKKDGQIRILDASEQCKKNETPLTWNIQGPPGQPGGKTLMVSKTTDISQNSSQGGHDYASAFCPDGMYATGGGFRVEDDNGPPLDVKGSQPFPGPGYSPNPVGWLVVIGYLPPVPNPLPTPTNVAVWVVCANATP